MLLWCRARPASKADNFPAICEACYRDSFTFFYFRIIHCPFVYFFYACNISALDNIWWAQFFFSFPDSRCRYAYRKFISADKLVKSCKYGGISYVSNFTLKPNMRVLIYYTILLLQKSRTALPLSAQLVHLWMAN
jgi:hypothetical protein